MSTTFLPTVPQVFVEVDRDKVLKQGVHLQDVYQTLQCFMGGSSSTTSTASAASGRSTSRPRATIRTKAENLGQFYVRNDAGNMVPLTALTDVRNAAGPEFTMRYNLYRCAQINASAKPGYSSAQAMKALEDVFAETMPREMGFDYMGMTYQEQEGARRRFADGHLRLLASLRLPHPGSAVRKLDSALQRAARHADCRIRRLRGL